jgi:hypothetical protein
MATCVNCTKDAKYEYKVGPMQVLYCETHLPRFLAAQKLAGQLGLTPEPVVVPEEEPTPKSKPKTKNATD